jgi:glycosyltransferase involved in cell wall biosynthesis
VVACVHTLDAGIFADIARLRGVIDALVAPNRLIAAAGVELCGLPPERVFYAPYRIEAGAGASTAADADAESPASGGRELTLLFAHRLDQHQKRALDLPPLMRALAARGLDLSLEIVGSGPEDEALRGAFAGEVAAGRVRFLGTLAPEALRALAPGRVLVVLSEWEMGPIVAWQAMAWGVPVVTSRYLGSGREGFLRDGANALCFPVGDTEAAAEAIARLVRQPELRQRLTHQARRDVRTRFSSETATAAWEDALQGVLALEPLPTPPMPPPIPPAGRLDRALGVRAAEQLRGWLGWKAHTKGPGDEWPHTEGGGLSHRELLHRLAVLDGVPVPAI